MNKLKELRNKVKKNNKGFSLVLVNGKIALKDDFVTGETGGEVLTL